MLARKGVTGLVITETMGRGGCGMYVCRSRPFAGGWMFERGKACRFVWEGGGLRHPPQARGGEGGGTLESQRCAGMMVGYSEGREAGYGVRQDDMGRECVRCTSALGGASAVLCPARAARPDMGGNISSGPPETRASGGSDRVAGQAQGSSFVLLLRAGQGERG